jgi:hypothetical protein
MATRLDLQSSFAQLGLRSALTKGNAHESRQTPATSPQADATPASDYEQNLQRALKIVLFLTVTGGLVAGSIVSAYMASSMLASGLAAASEVGGLYGLSMGLGGAALASIPNAIHNKMFSYTGKDRGQMLKYLAIQAGAILALGSIGGVLGTRNGFAIAKALHGNKLTLLKAGNYILKIMDGRAGWILPKKDMIVNASKSTIQNYGSWSKVIIKK